ncbi:hypothetical protein [Niveibacterium umoris]|uniref:Uncharacterized protein n=1 Tax=Niveibacterium umoris TaxID=1193620 RepID=A0A840BNP4_9RHOO|nr:hypothetical protein [Niveibacterium umoris]MBB4013282.1 hypothetical protein [Niveibacterium umoris]
MKSTPMTHKTWTLETMILFPILLNRLAYTTTIRPASRRPIKGRPQAPDGARSPRRRTRGRRQLRAGNPHHLMPALADVVIDQGHLFTVAACIVPAGIRF